MKIRGNVVGTPMKRPDFEQKDPKKSDFIKNNPIPDITEEDEGKIPKVVGGKYVLTDDLQPKEDDKLQTKDKTVVGAINELKDNLIPPINADVNLTGTTWVLKDDIDVSRVFNYNVIFTSNGESFSSFKLESESDPDDSSDESYMRLSYGLNTAYFYRESENDGYWYNKKYKTISFAGGVDVTNSNLINWLSKNGTLQEYSVWSEINNLKTMVEGHTWRLNDTFNIQHFFKIDFDFVSNGETFKALGGDLLWDESSEEYYQELYYWKPDNTRVLVWMDVLGWRKKAYQTIHTIDNISLSDIALKIQIGAEFATKNKTIVGAINELYDSNFMLVGYVDEKGKLWEDAKHQKPLFINLSKDFTMVQQAEISLVKIVVDLHTQELIFGGWDFIINEQLKGTELGEWLELIKKTGVKASQDMNEAITNSYLYQIVMDFLGECQNLLESVGNWFETTQVYQVVTEFVDNTSGAIKDSLTNYVNESEIDELSDEEETTPKTRSVKATKSEKTIVGAIQKANRRIAEIEKTVGEGIDTSNLQPKTDATLKTTSKTISGAINELQSALLGEETINLTDLTNTTWLLNEEVDTTINDWYRVHFTSNETQYTTLSFSNYEDEQGEYNYVHYGDYAVYVDGWRGNYQYITITGGDDATNTDLIDWLFRNGDLQRKGYLAHLQAKEDKGLNTESKEIVGAINEVNSKAGTPIVTTTGTGSAYEATVDGITELKAGISFIMIPHTQSTTTQPTLNVNDFGAITIRRAGSNGLSYYGGYRTSWLTTNRAYRVMYNGLYWIVADSIKPRADDLDGRVSVTNGGVPSCTTDNANQILRVNANGTPVWSDETAGGDIDTSNLATVDKIGEIYTNDGDVNIDVADDSGISWTNTFGIYDDNGETIKYGALYQDLPIVAGNGIEFEIDEENQKVKINATGGGGSENTILSVTVETDYPTTMSAIIEAIQAVGGDLPKLTFVTLTGYMNRNLMMSFWWRGGNCYTVVCVDADSMEKIYNPATNNSVNDVTSLRIADFLYDGTPKEEMPQIRFVSMPCEGYLGWMCWVEINGYQDVTYENLKFTIEIVSGTLQVGDAIQLCRMSKYGDSTSYAPDGTKKYHPPKRKLRRLFEYTITEEDLEKRFITFEVPWNDKKAIKLFTKWATSGVNDKTIYFRIRRPKGEINSGSNGGGMTVDALFSNVVSVRCLSYGFEWYPNGEDIEFYQIRIT